MNWNIASWKKSATRSMIAVTLSAAMLGGVASYELLRPTYARAAAPVSSASPLDDSSIGALLSLDHAMETLASRVTPAVVNVTVTSKSKPDQRANMQGMDDDDMQNFFGQFFGQNRRRMQIQPRGPQFEHGLGSGVIISLMATSLPTTTSSKALPTSASP